MTILYMDPKEYKSFSKNYLKAEKQITTLSVKERAEALSLNVDKAKISSELYKQLGDIAFIDIKGPLFSEENILYKMFGMSHTGYDKIQEAVALAEAEDSIKSIVFNVDSPGGYMNGLDITAEVIAKAQKPTSAVVYSQACSAGYYLASQADNITAITKATMIGSIGVALEVIDSSEAEAKDGIKIIQLTNDLSTDKRPNIATEEGQQVYKEELNALYSVFEERVVEGRKKAEDFTLSRMRDLKGKTVLAKKALKIGLIDSISTVNIQKIESSKPKESQKEIFMDMKEVIASHPEVQASLDTMLAEVKAEALKSAGKNENDRIFGLLSIAKVSLSDTLSEAIKNGDSKEAYAVKVLEAQTEPKPTAGVLPKVEAKKEIIEGAEALHKADAEAFERVMNKALGKKGDK